ncbi:MAG TPA: redox-regulated ATPase YchF [Euryarchaeota archaeon]|nr:MAG: redox-regulated ATPase YchF [Thermoplasmata archaeon]HHD16424.1 redox-regulated ATPase YchF [Euryarchaeota archaeon]
MEIGLVGKPNVGKSTFFEASTLAGVEIANYPFTTIKANRGIGYLRTRDPGPDLGVESEPKNSILRGDTRLVPVELLDVAGLVPDAHSGKGLGNQFLDDLRQAKVLIHVIDASGSTDIEGNPVDRGSHDPGEDVDFLVREIDHWFHNIIIRDWIKISRTAESSHTPVERLLAEKLTGLGINIHHIADTIHHLQLDERPTRWTDDQMMELSSELRKRSKPILIAANKADRADDEQLRSLESSAGDFMVIPTCSEAEMALRKADKAGLINYVPGDGDFEIPDPSRLSAAQKNALEVIRGVLERFGSTNVQKVLETAAYELLELIVVYPVEDEHRFTDHDGRVLPDAYLMRKGSTARDLAYRVHTDLGDHFIRAIDCRTGRSIGADHELKMGDVVKIHSNA